MKKNKFLALALVLTLGFASCGSDDEDVVYVVGSEAYKNGLNGQVQNVETFFYDAELNTTTLKYEKVGKPWHKTLTTYDKVGMPILKQSYYPYGDNEDLKLDRSYSYQYDAKYRVTAEVYESNYYDYYGVPYNTYFSKETYSYDDAKKQALVIQFVSEDGITYLETGRIIIPLNNSGFVDYPDKRLNARNIETDDAIPTSKYTREVIAKDGRDNWTQSYISYTNGEAGDIPMIYGYYFARTISYY